MRHIKNFLKQNNMTDDTNIKSDFKPRPHSMWLVEVECRQNVVVVGADGKGIFIPGQEPYWDLSHVSKWINEIIPAENMAEELHLERVARTMLPIVENQVKRWENKYNKDMAHWRNGNGALRQYVDYLEKEIYNLKNEINYLEGNEYD